MLVHSNDKIFFTPLFIFHYFSGAFLSFSSFFFLFFLFFLPFSTLARPAATVVESRRKSTSFNNARPEESLHFPPLPRLVCDFVREFSILRTIDIFFFFSSTNLAVGPEEEKLLGSILLPSYRVTACRPEDKVNRKFAFKAEHANMRTYHFAAENRESMNQWVNALTLATLLQDPSP